MAFTYGEDLTIARDYVRFHSGDVLSPGFLSDALIASLIAVKGSNNAAVIAAIQNIIFQLSRPDFQADWLKVNNAEARKGYQALLAEKRAEFGIAAITASTVVTYRHDSYQTSDVDYNADGSADNG
jgi:hypothetical protein